MNPTQRSRDSQGNIRKHKIWKCPPSTAALWSAVGFASGRLCREGDQLWGSALGTGLGYSLPLSTAFLLCIIYCRDVSKQKCNHIIDHRDPWKNMASISGEAVTPLLRKSKWGTSLASAPCLVLLEERGDGATQCSPSPIPVSVLPFQQVRACGHSRNPN